MKVAIFGAGTMGSGIAQVFAAKGHTALMYASSVASAQKHKDKLAASLAKRVAKGKMTQEAVDALLANILVEEKSACADADLIIECVKEDMATKKELLCELDELCKPEAIFASNTSSLSITEMGNGLKHPVNGYHGDPLQRDRRRQVSSCPAAEEDGPRRPAGPQVRQGLLRLQQVNHPMTGPLKSGPVFYIFRQ